MNREILALAAKEEFGDVVDIGCGRGQLGVALLEAGLAQSVAALDRHAGHVQQARRAATGLAFRAIVQDLELDHPIAEHLMNLGFVPGLEVTVERSSPGGDPRVYRVEGTEVAMRRELSRHIHVSLVGAPAFGD